MQAVFCLAHPRPSQGFGSADMIKNMAMIEFFQPLPGRWRHGLSGADHPFDSKGSRIDAHIFCFLGDMKPVGWGVHHSVGPDLHDLVDSSLGVEGASGNDLATELF